MGKIPKQIKLKYVDPTEMVPHKGLRCALCDKKNIVLGSTFFYEDGEPGHLCYDCNLKEYMEMTGIKSKKEAEAVRRRMFDVGYLFSEMFFDRFIALNGEPTVKKMEAYNYLNQMANGFYNNIFSKKMKEKIELMEQEEIEKIFNKKLDGIDFNL